VPDDLEDTYFSGRRLYGDDFTPDQLEAWYDDEREGYANLGNEAERAGSSSDYMYRTFNDFHTFRYLPGGPLGDALGLGAADGGELLGLAPRLTSVTILEPSMQLRTAEVGGLPIAYCDPAPSGVMPFASESFDLVTAFGVLHHIPNVTTVVEEIRRVMRPGGYLTVREPVHSMGDWRTPRHGLTRRERGIPVSIFDAMMRERFTVVHRSWCDFPLWQRWGSLERPFDVRLDAALARAFSWNSHYHARHGWQKVRPRSVAMVLQRP
jgi:SAM-dependent methyltransferase